MGVLGDQLSRLVQPEMAVAGVAFAVLGLDDEIPGAADGHIQRVAGLLQGTGGGVAHGGDVAHEGDGLSGNAVATLAARQVFDEHHLLGLEPRGVHVGQVVGDNVQVPAKGTLPGERNKRCIFHLSTVPRLEVHTFPRTVLHGACQTKECPENKLLRTRSGQFRPLVRKIRSPLPGSFCCPATAAERARDTWPLSTSY